MINLTNKLNSIGMFKRAGKIDEKIEILLNIIWNKNDQRKI
jgi:hypothetical protein